MEANGGKTKEKRRNDLKTSGGREAAQLLHLKSSYGIKSLFSFPAESKAVCTDQWWEEPRRAEESCPDNKTSGRLCRTSVEGSRNKAALQFLGFRGNLPSLPGRFRLTGIKLVVLKSIWICPPFLCACTWEGWKRKKASFLLNNLCFFYLRGWFPVQSLRRSSRSPRRSAP